MSSSETESRKAAGEARRDVLGHGGQPGTASRYDAVLRYLRGLYAKAPKEQHVPESPETEAAEEAESDLSTEEK